MMRAPDRTYQVAINFLEQLRPGGPWALLAFDPNREYGSPVAAITTNDADTVHEFGNHDGRNNLYYSLNPLRRAMSKKAAKTDIAKIEFLHADLDPNQGERPADAKARYLKALETYKHAATAVVNSGNGIQALWRLKEPIDISRWEPVLIKKELKLHPDAQKIVDDVEARSKAIMRDLGCDDTSTFNIDRILRLPGTINLPTAKKKKKGYVECNSELIGFNGVAYALDDFPASPVDDEKKQRGPGRPKGSTNKNKLPPHLMTMLHVQDNGAGRPCGEYSSRNSLLFAFLKLTLPKGYSADTLVEVGLDPRFKGCGIYEHCIENGGESYLRRQIERALEEGLETADGRKIIFLVPGQAPANAKKIELAIKASSKCQIYRRGRYLVEPLWDDKVRDNSTNKLYLNTWLRQLNVTQLGNLVQKHAVEFQHRVKDAFKVTDWTSAQAVLVTLLGLEHQDLPKIRGIIMAPAMRADGSLIEVEGYDATTELWYRKSPDLKLPTIPDKPSKEEALAALQLYIDLLSECAFIDETSKSVALAAILTVALRAAFPNAPHFNFNAPAARSGKSYLCEIIQMITAGRPMVPTSGSKNPEEMEKRIETALLNGRQILYLGNLPDELELHSQALETIATEAEAEIRKLGKMEQGVCDCRGVMTVIINGNNIILTGALVERTLNCRLDTKMENPGERTYERRPKEMIAANRGEYLAAAFTIARAYMAAGRPEMKMKPFNGFDDWSRMVRAPLIWLGVADPIATIEEARELDPERGELRTLKDGIWKQIGTDKPFDSVTLEALANEKLPPRYDTPRFPEVRQALLSPNGKIDSKWIGRKLTNSRDRIVDGFRIEVLKDNKGKGGNIYQLVWCGEGEPPTRAAENVI